MPRPLGGYDHPNFTIRREQSFTSVVGANGVSCRMINFQKTRLVAALVTVIVAGTSAAAGNAAIIRQDGTALATATLGSSTAGVQVQVDLGDVEVASGKIVSTINGTDATGQYGITYEYGVVHDTTVND
jgi:hypothetical protein